MAHETQKTVTNWAEQTFGPVSDHTTLVKRAQIEMEELNVAIKSLKNVFVNIRHILLYDFLLNKAS